MFISILFVENCFYNHKKNYIHQKYEHKSILCDLNMNRNFIGKFKFK